MKLLFMLIFLAATLGPAALGQSSDSKGAPRSYRDRIAEWRKSQESDLKKDDGWLSVAGLFWLKEGENRVGADPACQVVLPPGSAVANVGALTLNEGRVTLHVADCVTVTENGKPVMSQEMKSDR